MRFLVKLLLGLLFAPRAAPLAQLPAQPSPRTILAIGGHAGDMELTAGALLLKQRALGDSIVLLHLTLGEGGNPKLSPTLYGEQKRREARAAAAVLGARVIFGPYRDGELPNSEEARRYVAEVIREVKPTLVITHWRTSIHRDHASTHAIVEDAVLLAALEGVTLASPPHRGVRLWYAENWEDAEGFSPYLYVDVSGHMDRWRQLVSSYEFVRGGIFLVRVPGLLWRTCHRARSRGAPGARRGLRYRSAGQEARARRSALTRVSSSPSKRARAWRRRGA